MTSREIITRRNLPHWYVPGAVHFVTYRLAGTIPVAVLAEMRDRREARKKLASPAGITPAEYRDRLHKQFFAEYDHYLDQNRQIDWLARPAIAAVIRGNLYHRDGKKYHLLAYCVMPNHVHVLLQPIVSLPESGRASECASWQLAVTEEGLSDDITDARSPLATIMHSLKSYTANRANELLGRSGQFWLHESYDHWVRDTDELCRIAEYIAGNPVKAGLATRPEEWPFGSAHDLFLATGVAEGLLKVPD
jgi:putative transposase